MTVAVPAKIGLGEVRLSESARRYLSQVIDSGRLSYGEFTRRFEREFAEAHGRRFAVFMNSGTSALQVALAAMKERYGWPNGAEVLVPAVTFVASYNVILQNRLRPVLIDVDPTYYGIDWAGVLDHLKASADPPVAVMPVHLFGQPTAPMPQTVRTFGLRVIDDSCETMFMPGCVSGEVTCFSTYVCHLISTGVGGLAVTDSPQLARLVRSLANHGRDGIYTDIDQELGSREVIEARFRFERVGYSYRATEFEAAIGCAEMETWTANLYKRRLAAAYLRSALKDLPLHLPTERIAGRHAYMMFPLVCREDGVRDALVQHLERRGIETRRMMPLTDQPYIAELHGEGVEDRYPVARWINRSGFYVPCHQHLSEDDLSRMAEAFRDFWRR